MTINKSISEPLQTSGWRTSSGWGEEFEPLPDRPGIYLHLLITMPESKKAPYAEEIIYIGQSRSIARRNTGHPLLGFLSDEYIQVWFKEFPIDQLLSVEKFYIHKFAPRYNKMHNRVAA